MPDFGADRKSPIAGVGAAPAAQTSKINDYILQTLVCHILSLIKLYIMDVGPLRLRMDKMVVDFGAVHGRSNPEVQKLLS